MSEQPESPDRDQAAPRSIASRYLLPGDIALVRSPGLLPSINVLGQRIVGRPTQYSHVLISLGGDVWCHADTSGVDLVETSNVFLQDKYLPGWKILRLPSAEKDFLGRIEHLATKAPYHVGLPYNYGFLIPKPWWRDNGTFCSELLAKLHRNHAADFDVRVPQYVLPGDIERLAAENNWLDVTDVYHGYLKAMRCRQGDTEEPRFAEMWNGLTEVLQGALRLQLRIQVQAVSSEIKVLYRFRSKAAHLERLQSLRSDLLELHSQTHARDIHREIHKQLFRIKWAEGTSHIRFWKSFGGRKSA